MATHAPECVRLHTPTSPRRTLTLFPALALYRALRRLAGPVFAWRMAFGERAAS